MFEKLGLRYVVFTDRGILTGLLTKKDLWYVLNEGEMGRVGHGAGVLREEANGREDERGLLRTSDGDLDTNESDSRRDEG